MGPGAGRGDGGRRTEGGGRGTGRGKGGKKLKAEMLKAGMGMRGGSVRQLPIGIYEGFHCEWPFTPEVSWGMAGGVSHWDWRLAISGAPKAQNPIAQPTVSV